MKIKDIWNKFLELRKSPACIICAFIGLLDILFWSFNALFVIYQKPSTLVFYAFFRVFWAYRVVGFWYYIVPLLTLLFVELMLKLQIKWKFVKNNKAYKMLWIIGFVAFLTITILLPLLIEPFKFLWDFF